MMDYWIERDLSDPVDVMVGITPFIVMSGDRTHYATTRNMRDATLVRQSISLLELMSDRFPGLINGEDDVSGGDLVDFFNESFQELKTLKSYLAGDGEFMKDEEIYDPEVDATSVPAPTELELARAWLKARNALEDEISANVKARIKADRDHSRPTLLSENPAEEQAAYKAFRNFDGGRAPTKSCTSCDGAGEVLSPHCSQVPDWDKCTSCDGSGKAK